MGDEVWKIGWPPGRRESWCDRGRVKIRDAQTSDAVATVTVNNDFTSRDADVKMLSLRQEVFGRQREKEMGRPHRSRPCRLGLVAGPRGSREGLLSARWKVQPQPSASSCRLHGNEAKRGLSG